MENNRILQNNKISHFILRIDFTKDIQIDYKMLSESLKDEFATFKTELLRCLRRSHSVSHCT